MDPTPSNNDTPEAQTARSIALGDILKERRHQIARGHTPHADGYLTLGELTQAAMATIAVADDAGQIGELYGQALWPFDYRDIPKSSEGRRWLLVRAAALILAELERLPRPDDGTTSPAVLLLQGATTMRGER